MKNRQNEYKSILRELSPIVEEKNLLIGHVSRVTESIPPCHQPLQQAWAYYNHQIFPLGQQNRQKILSNRENEILYLLAKGYKSKEIAHALHINIKTVYKHRQNMLSKTGVQNTAQLISFGIENNLISFPAKK
jgi:DNA-binding NarL/FixJ family response regulator